MTNIDEQPEQTRGKHWTEEEARRVLAARARSGLSVRAFAMREGLSPKRLHWWNGRLEMKGGAAAQGKPSRRRRAEESAARFVPVLVKKTRSASALARTPIVIRRGATTMEIDGWAEVSPAWVAAVMIALERAACS